MTQQEENGQFSLVMLACVVAVLVRCCYTQRVAVSNPGPAKGEFGRLMLSDMIGSPLRRRGEDLAGAVG